MGWSSGTDYFDTPLDLFLKYVPEDKRLELVADLYELISMGDWDTEDESNYYPYIRKIRVDSGDWDDYAEETWQALKGFYDDAHSPPEPHG